MKHADTQLGIPAVQYIGTKAAIEALSGVSSGAIAVASDTGEIGMYNSGAWKWAGTATFVGLSTITVGTSPPGSPTAGDLWIDTN